MKRSEINGLIARASDCFLAHGWALPPEPRWDVTDFGLGEVEKFGLVLINLCEEQEYCEKLMYAEAGMVTPAHAHGIKKEDIVVRWGELSVRLWNGKPSAPSKSPLAVRVNGRTRLLESGERVMLGAGERITLVPGVYHEFEPATPQCILGEVSTANDDANDNYFENVRIGRFPEIEEDEPRTVSLISDATR